MSSLLCHNSGNASVNRMAYAAKRKNRMLGTLPVKRCWLEHRSQASCCMLPGWNEVLTH